MIDTLGLARLRSLHFIALLFASALSVSCDNIGAPSFDDDDDDEVGEVGVVSANLAEGRRVAIDFGVNLGDGFSYSIGETTFTPGRNEVPIADLYQLLSIFCFRSYAEQSDQEAVRTDQSSTTNDVTTLQSEDKLSGRCGTSQEVSSLRIQGQLGPAVRQMYRYSGTDATAFANLCTAHLALRAAGAVQPLYVSQASNGPLTLSEDDPGPGKRSFVIPVQNSASSAAFALFAVDHFRQAVIHYTVAFAQCTADQLDDPYGPTQVSLAEVLSSNLSDAMSSMVEAAKEAEKYLAASAAAKTSTAPDITSATIRAWRERRDSRLEAVSIYGALDERLFEPVPRVELWEMQNPDVDIATAGSQPNSYFSTKPEAPLPGYAKLRRVGWIYSPDAPQPPNTRPLATWKNSAGYAATNAGGSSWAGANLGSSELHRVEGWVYSLKHATMLRQWEYRSMESPYRFLWGTTSTAPAGFLLATSHLVFNSALPDGTRFPVATLRAPNVEAKRAERLLVQYRINPCLSDSGPWCSHMNDGTTPRSKGDIARELWEVLRAEQPGAFQQPTSIQLLADLGLSIDDLAVAAQRLVQRAEVMGAPIVRDTRVTSGPPRVSSIDGDRVDPAYLYARTLGRIDFKTDQGRVADRSVLAALAYASSGLKLLLPEAVAQPEPASVRIQREAIAWASQYLAPTTRVYGTDGEFVRMVFDRAAATTTSELMEQCDVWLGEAGLRCALDGAIGGVPCNPSQYRFSERVLSNSESWRGNATAEDWIYLTPESAPLRKINGQQTRTILEGDRLYVTCDEAGAPKVAIALEVAFPVDGSSSDSRYLPPMSDALLESLSNILAADGTDPGQAALSCAGVPYNVRLALEDELTEATTGKDSIESSFAHYLNLAKDAATTADDLGEELVAQGLSMDERSEKAREELEDLCGGVVDVSRFEEVACDKTNCDVMKLLEQASTSGATITGDPVLDSDLTGVAQCLGVTPSSKPVWASVGDQDLCVWRYYPAVGQPISPPLTCPPGVSLCADLPRAPRLMPTTTQCSAQGCSCADSIKVDGVGIPELQQDERPSGGVLRTIRIKDNMNVAVTNHISRDATITADEFSCRDIMRLRKPRSTSKREDLEGYASMPRPSWANQEQLRRIAEAIGYEEDVYGFPTLTLNGKVWRRFGDAGGPYGAADLDFDWPCTRPPLLTPVSATNPSVDSATAALCTDADVGKSLFCGEHCGASLPNTYARLRDGIVSLKGLTGASFENVLVRREWKSSNASLADDMSYAGPDYAGRDVFLSADGSRAGFYTEAEMSWSNARVQPYSYHAIKSRDDVLYSLLAALPGQTRFRRPFHYGMGELGWPVALYSLWAPSPGACADGFIGCGDMDAILGGWRRSSARAQLRFPGHTVKPTAPTDAVYYEQYDCGELDLPGPLRAAAEAALGGGYRAFCAINCEGSASTEKKCGARLKAGCVPYVGCAVNQFVGCGCKHRDTSLADIRDEAEAAGGSDADYAKWGDLGRDAQEYAYHEVPEVIGGTEVPFDTVMDGLEIACGAVDRGALSCPTLLKTPIAINSVEDFPKLSARMNCAADSVQEVLDRLYVADVPKDIVDAISTSGIVQTYPQFRGEYGESVAYLGGQLLSVQSYADNIVQYVRDVSGLLNKARAQASATDIEIQIGNVDGVIAGIQADLTANDLEAVQIRSEQAISRTLADCAAGLVEAVGGLVDMVSGKSISAGGGAMIRCMDTAVQVSAENQIQALNDQNIQLSAELTKSIEQKIALGKDLSVQEKNVMLAQLSLDIGAKFDQLHGALRGLQKAQAEVHGTLAKLDTLRNKARRAAANLLMLSNDDLGRQYAVNTVMRARMNTLRVRYEKARDNAIRLGYIARRAVEQKLGVELSLMDRDMTLVPAPKGWVDTLCTLSGFNYKAIRTNGEQTTVTTTTPASGPPTTTVTTKDTDNKSYDYADAYVGEWVTNLANFVQSYRLDYPFKDAQDIAVVSLRDDIVHATDKECSVDGWNLLYHSDGTQLSSGSPGSAQFKGWSGQCDASGVRAVAEATAESPYDCEDASQPCRALGTARGFLLYSKFRDDSCGGVDQTGETSSLPQQPPTDRMAYWYRADWCDPTRTTFACEDRSGLPGRNSGRAFGPAVTLISAGIGGMPTLNFPKDSYINIASGIPVANEYTLVSVLRPNEVAGNYLWQSGYTAADGRPQSFVYHINENWWSLSTSADTRGSAGPALGLQVGGKLAPQTRSSVGDILVIRGSSQGTDVYVNGNLRAHTPLAAVPSTLQGYLAYAVGGAMQVAETLAYSKPLTPSELDQLHGYLAGRYGQKLNPPVHWFNADEVDQLRSGQPSALTGYRFTDGFIHDAATGQRVVPQNGDLDTSTMVPFAGSHLGLRFDNEHFLFKDLASVNSTVGSTNTYSAVDSSAPDYVATSVVNLDATGNPSHTIVALMNPLHSATTTRYVYLTVHCDTGSVGFLNTFLGSERISAPGAVTCGVPAVISLRGAETGTTTDLFVNGERVLSDPSFARATRVALGGRNGLYMRGVVADMQFHVKPMSEAEVIALHAQLGAKYGIPTAGADDGEGSTGGTVAARGPARFSQNVRAFEGDYIVSWHQPSSEPAATLLVEYPDGTSESWTPLRVAGDTIWPAGAAGAPAKSLSDPWLRGRTQGDETWLRYFTRISVPEAGMIGLGFLAPTDDGSRLLAGIQLESVQSAMSAPPRDYLSTSQSLQRRIAECEDTDGSAFRELWTRDCEYYCPPGSGDACLQSGNVDGLPKRCFRELTFGLALDTIQRGEQLNGAGFARGNFNYRFDEIAVNLVGTAIKDCSSSPNPSTCYGANFAQFSLRHDGPFRILNYEGDQVEAPLFPGNIQQAKGVLAERYVTNPISSADEALMKDYWRSELRGRPMDGSYRLRVYETDDLRFQSLEDVQIVLRYRYWTRFD